jgi:hypothetical protein
MIRKYIIIFFLLVLSCGLHSQEVGFGYSEPLILDNRLSEALPAFGTSEAFVVDARICETQPFFATSDALALDARISEAIPFYGFSDVFTAFTVVTIHLDNSTFSPPTDTCMQALQNITLSDVVIETNARLELVAGDNIMILNATHVESGAYLRAYIDNTWLVCHQMQAMLAASDYIDEDTPEWPSAVSRENYFTIYPNPTTGKFTFFLNEPLQEGLITIEIYSVSGDRIIHLELPGTKQYLFDLSAQRPGIYLIRVRKDNEVGVGKVIKQ